MSSFHLKPFSRWAMLALCFAANLGFGITATPRSPTMQERPTWWLLHSVWKGDVLGVRRAMAHGADMMASDYQTHYSAWMWASMMGNAEIMRLLIEQNPNNADIRA